MNHYGINGVSYNPISAVNSKSTFIGPSDEEKICLNLKLITRYRASKVAWDFGKCSSNQTYSNHQTYDIQCCQPEGNYTLDCHSFSRWGWGFGNYLVIEGSGKSYCNGGKNIQTVQHKSPNMAVVCINIKVVTRWLGRRASWKFGSCESNQTYQSHSTYNIECCQEGDFYELQCKGNSWYGGHLEIGGSQYCRGYWGGTKTATVYHAQD